MFKTNNTSSFGYLGLPLPARLGLGLRDYACGPAPATTRDVLLSNVTVALARALYQYMSRNTCKISFNLNGFKNIHFKELVSKICIEDNAKSNE
jgi:hypothetical protein